MEYAQDAIVLTPGESRAALREAERAILWLNDTMPAAHLPAAACLIAAIVILTILLGTRREPRCRTGTRGR